jgi:hypothetical protein
LARATRPSLGLDVMLMGFLVYVSVNKPEGIREPFADLCENIKVRVHTSTVHSFELDTLFTLKIII